MKNYPHHVIGGRKRLSPKFHVPYKIGIRRCQQQVNWKAYRYRHNYYFSNPPNNKMNGCNTESASNILSSQCPQPDDAFLPPKIDVLPQPLLCEQLEAFHVTVENVPQKCQSKLSDVCVSSSTSLLNSSFVDNITGSSLENKPSFESDPTVLENHSHIQVDKAHPGNSFIGPAVSECTTNPKSSANNNSIPALPQFLRIAVNKCSKLSSALLKLSEKELSGFTNFAQVN